MYARAFVNQKHACDNGILGNPILATGSVETSFTFKTYPSFIGLCFFPNVCRLEICKCDYEYELTRLSSDAQKVRGVLSDNEASAVSDEIFTWSSTLEERSQLFRGFRDQPELCISVEERSQSAGRGAGDRVWGMASLGTLQRAALYLAGLGGLPPIWLLGSDCM